ncbi:hypothetical protein E3N88_26211 [Mikania micrantha]|uniref:Uncharacterized protein n=1 Tax=Mikania micrantha TaxID=192012 RepID=A0A5N6N801_9ASTR|nr:hypothetical protein E3N88_26211 [Mikania micrantha]
MMNVGENRAQNGVLDCPESKNEEKFLSIGILASSRYAMEELNFLCDANQTKKTPTNHHQIPFSSLLIVWIAPGIVSTSSDRSFNRRYPSV